jgi:hydrogenase/urease accessory protein HupE
MKPLLRYVTPFVLFPLVATSLHAHPGHATDSFHLLFANPFSGAEHLFAWLAFTAGIALIVFHVRRTEKRAAVSRSSTKHGRS